MELIDIAREFLQAVRGELDPYTSRKGSVNQEGANVVTLLTPAHIQFAKYGRGPGKPPPIDPILEWVKKKGIIFSDTTAEGTAWAIAKSISKKGTSNYVPNAPNALEEAISKHQNDYLSQLSSAFAITIQDEMRDVEYVPKGFERYKF